MALGVNSIASAVNTVSVGSTQNQRRLTNVANGINTYDAVNMNQLNEVQDQVSSNSARIFNNTHNIMQNRLDIDQNYYLIQSLQQELTMLKKEARAGIAASADLISLSPFLPGKTLINVGTAGFKGETAFGFTGAHRLATHECIIINMGGSHNTNATLFRVGASWKF